jgi:glucose-6-phosphate 1-dehydrogenase
MEPPLRGPRADHRRRDHWRRPARRLRTEITIQFKRAPLHLFRDMPVGTLQPNQLVLRIQPEEGISLSFSAKVPGPQLRLGDVNIRTGRAWRMAAP